MKTFRLFGAAIVALSLVAGSAHAAGPSGLEVLQIRSEIKQLVDNYGIYRDNFDAKGYGNLFTPNGKLILYGKTTEGIAAIQKRVEDADHTGRSIHVMTSSQIIIVDRNHATGIQYATIYAVTPPAPVKEEDPILVKGPNTIGKYYDKYERTADGWKFAERRLQVVFSTEK